MDLLLRLERLGELVQGHSQLRGETRVPPDRNVDPRFIGPHDPILLA
jgi:hypothetical protein